MNKYNIILRDDDIYIDGTYKDEKVGELQGRKVYSATNLKLDSDWCVIICSSYYNEIMEYINNKNICDKNQIINLFAFDRYYGVLE